MNGMTLMDAAQFAGLWFLESSVIVALGLAAAWALRRREASLRSALLRATLLAALVVPLAAAAWTMAGVRGPAARWAAEQPAPAAAPAARGALADTGTPAFQTAPMDFGPAPVEAQSAPAAAVRSAAIQPTASQTPAAPLFRVERVLALLGGLWLAGLGVMLARLGGAVWWMERTRRASTPASPAVASACEALARPLGLPEAPAVRLSPRVDGPCLMGWRRLAILLPAEDEVLSGREVLAHELAHARRRDPVWNVAARVGTAVLWFHPLMHLLARRIEETADEAADDAVVQAGCDARAYAKLLTDLAESRPPYGAPALAALGVARFRSSLGRRIVRLLDTRRRLSRPLGRGVVAGLTAMAALIALVTGGAFASAEDAAAGAPESAAPAAVAAEASASPAPAVTAGAKVDAAWMDGPFAWQAEEWIAPDFEAFFPYDRAAGAALDAFFERANKDKEPDEVAIETMWRGLRTAKTRELFIIRWFGNRFVWGAENQDPRAIELLYHATDSPNADHRYNALYFGMSTTREKTPNLIRAMGNLLIRDGLDANVTGRVFWGLRGHEQELRDAIAAHSPSPEEEDIVAALLRHLDGEEDLTEWQGRQARARILEEHSESLVKLHSVLERGSSKQRLDILSECWGTNMLGVVEQFDAGAWRAAASDPDPAVRNLVARLVGQRWVWNGNPDPEAIALEVELIRDEDMQTRKGALYFGISTAYPKNEDVVRASLEALLGEPGSEDVGWAMIDQYNDGNRALWGLKGRAEAGLLQRELQRLTPSVQSKPRKLAAYWYIWTDLLGAPPVPDEAFREARKRYPRESVIAQVAMDPEYGGSLESEDLIPYLTEAQGILLSEEKMSRLTGWGRNETDGSTRYLITDEITAELLPKLLDEDENPFTVVQQGPIEPLFQISIELQLEALATAPR
ncbi:MAG: M56 family metallopeptidase [Sumerlaeia bacterium]